MTLFLAAIMTLAAGGILASLCSRSDRAATILGAGSAVLGCLLGLAAAIRALAAGPESLRLAWEVPYGSFYLELDALSAFFLLPVFGLSALAAVYGAEYLQAYREKKSLGPPWLFYNLLVASMAVVLASKNGVLFLVAWEVMALASFFLVTFENEREDVREAGWTYLVATHLGHGVPSGAFRPAGERRGHARFRPVRPPRARQALLFLLALVGFGTKAGFHAFARLVAGSAPGGAHPCFGAHVRRDDQNRHLRPDEDAYFSGRSSGVVGLEPVAIGVTLGRAGSAVRARPARSQTPAGLPQRGEHRHHRAGARRGPAGTEPWIARARGAGIRRRSAPCGEPRPVQGTAVPGAGAVLHATGTREIDRLGGLLKRMPLTGFTFLIGAVAICGLPPLNGFVSEFLIFLGAYQRSHLAGAWRDRPRGRHHSRPWR